jgi:hypothetical protein
LTAASSGYFCYDARQQQQQHQLQLQQQQAGDKKSLGWAADPMDMYAAGLPQWPYATAYGHHAVYGDARGFYPSAAYHDTLSAQAQQAALSAAANHFTAAVHHQQQQQQQQASAQPQMSSAQSQGQSSSNGNGAGKIGRFLVLAIMRVTGAGRAGYAPSKAFDWHLVQFVSTCVHDKKCVFVGRPVWQLNSFHCRPCLPDFMPASANIKSGLRPCF